MANIARKFQKIFAESAINNGQFGSLQAGTSLPSADPEVIQALAAYEQGWNDAVISGEELPALEEFQGLQYKTDYQLAYLLQKGMPEWDSQTDYHIGDISRDVAGTKLYRSLTDDNVGNALTDEINWRFLVDLANIGQGRNLIINGNFDIWQRGNSFSIPNAVVTFTADRWAAVKNGTTLDISKELFTVGQTDVPNNPDFFLRANNSVAGVATSDNAIIRQPIESVQTSAGKNVNISFWAKADANKDISIELFQFFGNGGSPSANVYLLVQKINLTTNWQKFSFNVNIPSISGKILGTSNNDYLALQFWFDAGSDFDARTDTLGHQTIIADISQVQVEEGEFATDFEQRSIGQEISLAQRYYRKTYNINVAPGTITTAGRLTSELGRGVTGSFSFLLNWEAKPPMRATPTVTLYNDTTGAAGTWREGTGIDRAVAVLDIAPGNVVFYNTTGVTANTNIKGHAIADAEL